MYPAEGRHTRISRSLSRIPAAPLAVENTLLSLCQLFRAGFNFLQAEHIWAVFCLPVHPISIQHGSQAVDIPGINLQRPVS